MKLSDVRPSVCLSVRPIIRPLHAAATGLLLSAVPTAAAEMDATPQHGAQQPIAISSTCPC